MPCILQAAFFPMIHGTLQHQTHSQSGEMGGGPPDITGRSIGVRLGLEINSASQRPTATRAHSRAWPRFFIN